jgi:hypothetical protein
MTTIEDILSAARALSRAARWEQALSLVDSLDDADPRIALVAAEVAIDSDLFAGTDLAATRLDRVGDGWDGAFLRLRHDYFGPLRDAAGGWRFGPAGKDPRVIGELRERAGALVSRAPDAVRAGWANMYLGLIADNHFAERDVAARHYDAALEAGEGGGDDLLVREALRHLGDHDHDNGDLSSAGERWTRATELGARAGMVSGVLSQQMLLAVLTRSTGDEAGAVRLAREVERWAQAVGATTVSRQARAFLAG